MMWRKAVKPNWLVDTCCPGGPSAAGGELLPLRMSAYVANEGEESEAMKRMWFSLGEAPALRARAAPPRERCAP